MSQKENTHSPDYVNHSSSRLDYKPRMKGLIILDMEEVWKDVVGYDGLYQISNLGRVKSYNRNRERILKANVGTSGYYYLNLYMYEKQKKVMIHQLVAESFLDHSPSGHKIIVDHINHNKLDNRVENLQLITQRENLSKDKFRKNFTSKYTGVSWYKTSKKWRAAIQINGKEKRLGLFTNELEAANAYQDALKNHMTNEAVI